jgi:hypothetical protein
MRLINMIKYIFIFAFLFPSWANSQSHELTKTVVYSYNENAPVQYGYRIPSLITTREGTLLAIAERRLGLHDHSQNDIVLKRSEDNGETWSEVQVIYEDGKNSLNDPCAVVLNSGRILLIFQKYPYLVHSRSEGDIQIADTGYDGPRNTRSYITYSDDDGKTWSKPREITKQVRPSERISIGSPGVGIQLKKGEYAGRVVFPIYETKKITENQRVWGNSVVFSDDEGETWHICNEIEHYDQMGYGNEAQIAEQSDGGIILIARNEGGLFRKYAQSEDGGQTWTNMRLNFELPGVACQGSLISVQSESNNQNIMIYSNPADFNFRTKGVIRLSYDDGITWPVAKKIPADFFAYSCLTQMADGKIGLLYETENYREIVFTSIDFDWIKKEDVLEVRPYLSIPIIDLDQDKKRQVVVDKEKDQYLGHVTTVLMEDGKTIYAVYPKGHGRGPIVLKRSDNGGKTWSERLPTPENWANSQEVPTLFKVEDASGKKRLIMFSGLYPARMAVSEDMGKTWSELHQIGNWGGIVVMGDVIPLKTGKGHYMALYHDDMRFFHENGKPDYDKDVQNFNSRMFTLYKSLSFDGGLTWSDPIQILKSREMHLCEPGAVRSPDGNEIAVLLRENSRRFNSQIIFSKDEGETWSKPRSLPNALNGDRHTIRYAPDGRLLIVFRDNSPKNKYFNSIEINREGKIANLEAQKLGLMSPTQGDWVAWVGTYDDLKNSNDGQYRIRIKDNTQGADCCYPGVELLPDGNFVTTTYGHWEEGEEPYILSVRFTLEEIDRLAKKVKH